MNPSLVDVGALVRDAAELDPLPASTTRLAPLLTGGDPDLQEVCETIRLDEALTGRLLGAANSAASGARVEITTVDAAVMRLGPGAVLALALGAGLSETLRQALPAYGLGEGMLWRHSVAAALAVERSRRYSRRPTQPEAFAAALLHDVGKLILARHLSDEVLQLILTTQERESVARDEAERDVLGLGHANLGARIARHWGLPEGIATAIEFHHSPLDAPDDSARMLCTRIALADAVASELDACCDGGGRRGLSPAVADMLGISSQGFGDLVSDVGERMEDVLIAYGG